jgi:hypothetical protein
MQEEVSKAFIVDGLPFVHLSGVQTQSATSFGDFIENAKINLKRGLRDLKQLPGLQVIKGHHRSVGLIGGGPSIRKEVHNIKEFQRLGAPIVACGSSYDWLREQDIVPDYCVICDPDPLTKEYIKLKHKDTIFLLSYSCAPEVFDYLNDNIVYGWHCYSEDTHKELIKVDPDYFGISGGCTVGLRSLNMFIMCGYTNIHLWGFDSCLSDDEAHHAYEFATDKEEIGEIYKICIGSDKPEGKIYSVVGYQMAQAHNFQDFYFQYHMLFTPTFHGEGMLQDFMKFIQKHGIVNQLKAEAYKYFNNGTDFVIGS